AIAYDQPAVAHFVGQMKRHCARGASRAEKYNVHSPERSYKGVGAVRLAFQYAVEKSLAVGVVADQFSLRRSDDGVYRLNAPCARVDGIEEAHHPDFVRHRDVCAQEPCAV